MSPNYFPEGVFANPKDYAIEIDREVAEWYEYHLAIMKEPSLFNLRSDKNLCAYRFVWLRSVLNPIAVRLFVNDDGSGQLISKVLICQGGDETNEIPDIKEKPISVEDVRSFELKLSNLYFWDLPKFNRVAGLDGTQFIIEGVKDGKYHVVERRGPDGLYKVAAFFLVELAGIEVDRLY